MLLWLLTLASFFVAAVAPGDAVGTVLRMDTNAKNAAARRLYQKLGYAEPDIVPCIFNGIPNVQLVLLEKKLT